MSGDTANVARRARISRESVKYAGEPFTGNLKDIERTMSAKEESISPEEKLLKVIQAGGRLPDAGKQPAMPGATTPLPMSRSAKSPAPESMAVPPEQKPEIVRPSPGRPPGLKPKPALVTPASPPAETSTAIHAVPAAKPQLLGHAPWVIAAGAPAATQKSQRRVCLGIGVISKSLAAAAIVMVLLLGWEVWTRAGTAQTRFDSSSAYEDAAPGTEPALPPSGAEAQSPPPIPGLVSLDRLLRAYAQRNPLGLPVAPPPGTNEPSSGTALMPWANYVKANLKLKGLSRLPSGDTEGIVADNKTGKLLFLMEGDNFLLERQLLKIESVGNDGVTITDGSRKTLLK
ncbi:MAG: hypothetical protein QME60_03385 [Verrucomicrobiota bacterium]|nr:hypothetical protein [Verrucomicrobiota bacterium]